MRILISSSMKVYSQLPEIVAGLEKHGHSVRMPEQGGGGVGVDFKRRMIENHLEKLRSVDALLLANIGGRIGTSTFFEAGWAFALGKPVFVLESIDRESDYAEDLLAIGAVELKGDSGKIKEQEQ